MCNRQGEHRQKRVKTGELIVENAFTAIGFRTEKAADATMPEDGISVFIGPSV